MTLRGVPSMLVVAIEQREKVFSCRPYGMRMIVMARQRVNATTVTVRSHARANVVATGNLGVTHREAFSHY